MTNFKTEIKALEKRYGKIRINCKGSTTLPIDLLNKFQGKIKKISSENKLKMATSFYKHGFISPFFVWDNKGDWQLLDGTQRRSVFNLIRESGAEIPGQLPVCEIYADSEKEAKKILLNISSQLGTYDLQELADWIVDIDKDISESIRLVDNDIGIIFKNTDLDIDLKIDEPVPEEKQAITPAQKKEEISPDVFVSHNPEPITEVEIKPEERKRDKINTLQKELNQLVYDIFCNNITDIAIAEKKIDKILKDRLI